MNAKNKSHSRVVSGCVVTLFLIQAMVLAYSATLHAPTLDEPAHLVAGISHWKFRRFEVYRVTPPLTHYVAAAPVILAGVKEEWRHFHNFPGSRPEFTLGSEFMKINGERSISLIVIARWACIPLALSGGLFCFLWSRDLYQSNLAGLVSLFCWICEPNLLGHSELITPDAAATSFGVGASYCFWKWLKKPSWQSAVIAGLVLGLALASKTTWVILFLVWPAIWGVWLSLESSALARGAARVRGNGHTLLQFCCMFGAAAYVINAFYLFDGAFKPLKDILFVSTSLTGEYPSGTPGNRFASSWLGHIPMPLPEQFLKGIDRQKMDFEHYGQPSYLRGQWQMHGWWYYYLYAMLVKIPHWYQLLFLLAIYLVCCRALQRGSRVELRDESQLCESPARPRSAQPHFRDFLVLAIPPAVLLVLVSSQTEFNHHFRYVLPVIGFSTVFVGAVAVDTSAPGRNCDSLK